MCRWIPFLLCCAPLLLNAQADAIRKMMDDSVAAWNRGDPHAFSQFYEDSPQTTFMGEAVVRGGQKAIEDRYRKAYPTREAMGKLSMSELEVRPLGTGFALVTGRFELQVAGKAKDPWGRFTLVVRQTPGGWKIIHDHTSAY